MRLAGLHHALFWGVVILFSLLIDRGKKQRGKKVSVIGPTHWEIQTQKGKEKLVGPGEGRKESAKKNSLSRQASEGKKLPRGRQTPNLSEAKGDVASNYLLWRWARRDKSEGKSIALNRCDERHTSTFLALHRWRKEGKIVGASLGKSGKGFNYSNLRKVRRSGGLGQYWAVFEVWIADDDVKSILQAASATEKAGPFCNWRRGRNTAPPYDVREGLREPVPELLASQGDEENRGSPLARKGNRFPSGRKR